ncbi:DUF418 domain-containing protein [Sphingomonas nostoxanthinifaciens]|uniref:DUF418 domain-containing protein n=1 Tax=Sphingomonas nostoxanthinifaciens TaxID=2872652 RepID=UPI001CC1DBA9|nr:DUF418 domain-containing protein [Sphingomonas nostoxanthinifaciens]UAK25265.1 DUF418 domain-containing protein [Sphingomonas nostoxanthinifaciens]
MADRDEAIHQVRLAPIAGRARIDVLDVLRGIAILGIFYMNIPFMGEPIVALMGHIRMVGWTVPDQWAWAIINVVAEGTQRGTLEMLFGAGMMILTAKAMEPDGPVAVADLYMRRTLWLLAFGLADVFLLLWPGDILHIYALAALLLFPFRRLGPKLLVALGLLWSVFSVVQGASEYVDRTALIAKVEAAHVAQAAHRAPSKDQQAALKTWQEKLDKLKSLSAKERKDLADETRARRGPFMGYAQMVWKSWLTIVAPTDLFSVAEAFCTMLIGIALFKWGVIQGQRTPGFYLGMAAIAYAFGMGARAWGVHEIAAFQPQPKLIWMLEEPARLAVTLGHVAIVNFLMQTRVGHLLLSPFKAAGKAAFSLYVIETIIGMWILFPGIGLGWWDRFGWFGLAVTATVTIGCLLVLANVWMRLFAMGPLEWAWRSLAYLKVQRFRHRRGGDPAIVVGP